MIPIARMFLSTVALFLCSLLISTVAADKCIEGCECKNSYIHSIYFINCEKADFKKVRSGLSQFVNFDEEISLSVIDSGIVKLSKSDFASDLPIVSLDLSKNRGLRITDDAFSNLKNLRSLTLNDISLAFNSPLNFLKGMNNLRSLSLGRNYQFGQGLIPASMLTNLGLSVLEKLNFHDCYLKGIEAGAFSGINLNGTLDLRANQIDQIPAEVRKLSNLTDFDISQNSLKDIPDDSFVGMNNLKSLSISNNYINEMGIGKGAFNGLNLREIIFEQSVLKTIPTEALSKQSMLKVLKLNNSPIKSIPKGAFRGDYCLEELDLSNVLVEIDMIHLEDQADCLQRLYLNNMQIKEIPSFIQDFKVLDALYLNGNYINTIKSGTFVDTKVSRLSLENNPLSAIEDGAFAEFPQSIMIDLTDTQLKNFTFVLSYPYGTFRQITMGDYMPSCDCDLALVEYRVYVMNGECKLDGNRTLHLGTDEFHAATTKCWPEGVRPVQKDVWTDDGSGSSLVSSQIFLLAFCLSVVVYFL